MKTTIIAAGKTDIGRRRSSNQDQFLIAEAFPALRITTNSLGVLPTSLITGASKATLMIVADGMGGHQGGSRAAELAIRLVAGQLSQFNDWYRLTEASHASAFETELQEIVGRAHRAVVDESRTDAKFRGMGTTLTLAITVDEHLWLAHVGDSRCYRIQSEVIEKLTRDHTVADQIASRGGINPAFLERSPWSNVLWNAIGADADEVEADILHFRMEVGQRYVLCSDGLNKHVGDVEILQIVKEAPNPHAACERLVMSAVENGGSDNVTTIVFEAMEAAEAAPITRLHLTKSEAVFQTATTEILLNKHPTTAEVAAGDSFG